MSQTTKLLNAGEMARRLGVRPAWLRSEAAEGRLPGVPAGQTYLFDADIVERVLRDRARRTVGAQPPADGEGVRDAD